jgi:hypothetical protein
MCKEIPVIPVNRGVDPKKKWREEERHKRSLTKNVDFHNADCQNVYIGT